MKNTNKLVADRFNQLLSKLELNVAAFAKKLGYDRADKFYNISKGKFLPSFEILFDITNKFEFVNIGWLINGTGNMFNEKENIIPPKKLEEQVQTEASKDDIANLLRAMLKEKDAEIKELNREIGELKAGAKSKTEKSDIFLHGNSMSQRESLPELPVQSLKVEEPKIEYKSRKK